MANFEIKNIDSPDFDLNNFPCDKIDDFFMYVTLSIGFSGEEGGDNFDICVYSIKWLQKNIIFPIFLKKVIVVDRFDLDEFNSLINEILLRCADADRNEAMKNVAKYLDWEFDGYKNHVDE